MALQMMNQREPDIEDQDEIMNKALAYNNLCVISLNKRNF